MLVAEGVAEGEHRLADHEIARRPHVDHREIPLGGDLDYGQIGPWVVREEGGGRRPAGGEGHLDPLHALDDVVIGDDVAAGVDDHPGAHAVDAPQFAPGLVVGVGDQLLAVNVDDRIAGLLDGLNDGGAPRLTSWSGRHRGREDYGHDRQGNPRTPHGGLFSGPLARTSRCVLRIPAVTPAPSKIGQDGWTNDPPVGPTAHLSQFAPHE